MPNYSADVSDPAYMDKLPDLKRRLPPGAIDIMRRAMTVDDLAWTVVRVVAFALSMQDQRPSDFAVVIEDAQDIPWENYVLRRTASRGTVGSKGEAQPPAGIR